MTNDSRLMTVLVTGGAGFIGSNFIRYILNEHPNWVVINLDKLTYAGNLANLADIEAQYGVSRSSPDSGLDSHNSRLKTPDSQPRYFFVKGDICNRELVDSLFSGTYFSHHSSPITHHPASIDAVVNFAAESHVDRSILDASPFIETNIKGTQVLLDAARTHWGRSSDSRPSTHDSKLNKDSGLSTPDSRLNNDSRLFVQISTDEVYGSLGKTGKFTEDSPLRPNSPYAASKASADMLCRSYYKAYDFPVIITRSSNNHGPYQFPEKLIPLMIRNALKGKELPVYGEGKQVRDWLYVKDNCRAIDLVLQHGKPGEVYNIAGNCEKRNIEIVKLICRILEEKLKENPSLITHHTSLDKLIEFIPDPRGSAHDFRYALDCSKIEEELSWEPQHDFEEGLEQTIEWYLENQDWVENVITGEYQEYYEKVYG